MDRDTFENNGGGITRSPRHSRLPSLAVSRLAALMAITMAVIFASGGSTAALDGPQNITPITSGQAVNNVFVSEDQWVDFSILVPPGASHLNVTITGTGDVDLYTRFDDLSTLDAYDCWLNQPGSDEACNHASPQAGTWYLSLWGYDGGTVSITATYCWQVSLDASQAYGDALYINGSSGGNCPGTSAGSYQFTHNFHVTYATGGEISQPVFAAWVINGAEYFQNPYGAPITGPVTAKPIYAVQLQSGIQLVSPSWDHYYFIDVPPNTAELLVFGASGGEDPPEVIGNHQSLDLVSNCGTGVTNFDCEIPLPSPGRWYFGLQGSGENPSITATLTACGSVSTQAIPAAGGTISLSPESNCGTPGYYRPGTLVTATATANPDYALAGWQLNGFMSPSKTLLTALGVGQVIKVDAIFAKQLTPGTASPYGGEFPETWFYVDVPANAASLQASAGTGSVVGLYTGDDIPGADICHSPADGPAVCTENNPSPGRRWVAIWHPDASGEVTVTLTPKCYALTTTVSPAGSGTVTADPPPNCDNGTKYTHGTQVNLSAAPAANHTFARWTGALTTTTPSGQVTMNSAQSVTAHFGRQLTNGVQSPPTTHGAGQVSYFYIDLAQPAEALNVQLAEFAGNVSGLSITSGTVTGTNLCNTAGDNCSVEIPPAGRYWILASGLSIGDSVTFRVTATIVPLSPACYTLTTTISPAGSGTITANPPPDCPADATKYLSGTIVELTAIPAADHEFAFWTGGVLASPDTTISVAMSGDETIRATFGAKVTAGQLVTGINLTTEHSRYFYYIDLPAGVQSMTATTSATGNVNLATWRDLFGSPICQAASPDSAETCVHQQPASGRWWFMIYTVSPMSANFEVTLEYPPVCYELTFGASPAGGGTITADPPPNCDNGTKYTEGTQVTLTATAEANYTLAKWDPDHTAVDNQVVLSMHSDISAIAHFAQHLTADVPVNDIHVEFEEWRFFTIDVPPGTAYLRASIDGTGISNIFTRFGAVPRGGDPSPTTSDCRPWTDSYSLEFCEHLNPQAGTWWIGVLGWQPATVTLVATFTEQPTCYTLETAVSPAGSGTITADPLPNCDNGSKYAHGTEVTLSANPSGANTFATWEQGQAVQGQQVITMDADKSATAHFAQHLTSGVPVTDIAVAYLDWRYFAIEVPVGATLFEATLSGTGDYDLLVTSMGALPVNWKYDCGDALSGGAKCQHYDPAAGTWWIAVIGYGQSSDLTLTATVLTTPVCHSLDTIVSPAGSGTIIADPLPDCDNNTGYTRGTEVTLSYQANPGAVFAAWRTGEQNPVTTANPTLTVTMDKDREVEAYFGIPLTDGQAVPEFHLDLRHARMFYIDVPDGFQSLRFAITGTPGGSYGARFGSPITSENGAYVCGSTVNQDGTDECAVPDPAAGRWWFVVHSQLQEGSSFAFTVSLSQEVVCFPVTLVTSPSSGGTLGASIPPNCPGGYESGTQVTFTAVPNPGYAVFKIARTHFADSYSPTSQVVITYPEFAHFTFTAHFSQAVTPGTPLAGIALPEADYRYFHVDVPPGVAQFVATTTSDWLSAYSPAFELGACFVGALEPCAVDAPTPGRWFFEVWVSTASTATFSVTFTLLPEPTLDSLSQTTFVSGMGPVTFSVFGSGFTPQSIVRWEGIELDTLYISPTELQATVPRELTYGPARTVTIDVVQGSQANPQAAESPAASNGIDVTLARSQSDVNCDNETSAADITWLLQYLASMVPANACSTDANGDGSTNLADTLFLRRELAGLTQPVSPPIP